MSRHAGREHRCNKIASHVLEAGVHLCELLPDFRPVHDFAEGAAEVRPRLVHAHLRHHIRMVVRAALCSRPHQKASAAGAEHKVMI